MVVTRSVETGRAEVPQQDLAILADASKPGTRVGREQRQPAAGDLVERRRESETDLYRPFELSDLSRSQATLVTNEVWP